MLNHSLRAFRVHGIDIYLHSSWWIIFALLSYSLSVSFFPQHYPNQTPLTYWFMALLSAVLLFTSVLCHELCHSFVARAHGIKVDKIVLFFFGGVASLPKEDMPPKTELLMAAAGPLFSLAVAGIVYWIHQLPLSIFFKAVTFYIWQLNLAVGLFNLVPGYPLDGGRVFRALLMFHYKDIRKATRIASAGGKCFGGILMFFGFLGILVGVPQSLWFILIGGFIWFVARSSYENVVMKDVLNKVPLKSVLETKYISIKPHDSLGKVVELYKQGNYGAFVVEKQKRVLGIIDIEKSPELSPTLWKTVVALDIMIPADKVKMPSLQNSAYDVLKLMDEQGLSVLPVMSKGKIQGIVHRRRIIHMLTLGMKYT
ncbi:MAG TPA: site-2 protease family protein [Candidatus Nanoarchaeia archaeon]|nr:site-2 protease family protein [Candidatus Nanoarchaeia archaeon]